MSYSKFDDIYKLWIHLSSLFSSRLKCIWVIERRHHKVHLCWEWPNLVQIFKPFLWPEFTENWKWLQWFGLMEPRDHRFTLESNMWHRLLEYFEYNFVVCVCVIGIFTKSRAFIFHLPSLSLIVRKQKQIDYYRIAKRYEHSRQRSRFLFSCDFKFKF